MVLDRCQLISLLQKAYFQQISVEEMLLLSAWRKESAENEDLYQRITKGETIAEMLEWRKEFDPDKVSKAIQNRIKTHKQYRFRIVVRWIAASAILALGVGTLYFTNPFEEDDHPIEWVASQIQPGSSRAILTLGNGQQVVLDKKPLEFKINGRQSVTVDSAILDYSIKGEEGQREMKTNFEEQNIVEVPVGGEYQLILADGTKVWINAASKLTYPVIFAGDQRLVTLVGEAYFEVAPDSHLPFIVRTAAGMEIKVTGTRFNVEAYLSHPELKTTLLEGCVEVTAGEHQVRLHPNEQFSYDQKSNRVTLREVNVREVIAWKNGWFVFDNTPLEDILETIRRWYNIEIEYRDSVCKHFCFTGDLSKYDSFEAVLRMFEDTRKVDLEIQSNRLIVGKH